MPEPMTRLSRDIRVVRRVSRSILIDDAFWAMFCLSTAMPDAGRLAAGHFQGGWRLHALEAASAARWATASQWI